MDEAIARLTRGQAEDLEHAFAVISEAVWRVTLADAALVRHHYAVYENLWSGQPPDGRVTEGTFAGLRFVRNRMGYHAGPADFIHPADSCSGPDRGDVTAWTCRSLPEPGLGSLPPRGQGWEMTRYRASQRYLAGHPLCGTFTLAAAFLKLASANRGATVAAPPLTW